MELQQLRYFVHVAKSESISRSARALSVTQPALSKSISKLESELGCPLFDRVGKRIYLNEQGRAFLSEVEEPLRALNEAAAQIGVGSEEAASLVIGVFGPQDAAILCATDFMKAHPNVKITLEARNPVCSHEMMRTYDAVFFPELERYSNIAGIPYAHGVTKLLVPADHRLAAFGSIDLRECQNEQFVLADTTAGTLERSLALCEKNGFKPHVRAVTTSGAAQQRFVEAGLGVALIQATDMHGKGVQGNRTKLLDLQCRQSEEALMFACGANSSLSSAARAFRDESLGLLGISADSRTLAVFEKNR